MFHENAIDAVHSASSLAEKLIFACEISSQANSFIVVVLTQPNGSEFEINKP